MRTLGRRRSDNIIDARPNARIKRAFEDANIMRPINPSLQIKLRQRRYYPRNPG